MSSANLWAYYTEVAKHSGKQFDAKKGVEIQANYSLYWFYGDAQNQAHISRVASAFLGQLDSAQLPGYESLPPHFSIDQGLLNPDPKRALNEDQRFAIEAALKNPVSIIQGPPGTGKTEMILNLLSCIRVLGKTAAMVSCNGMAIQNVWDKVSSYEGPQATPNQRALRSAMAKLGNIKNRNAFNHTQSDSSFKSHTLDGPEHQGMPTTIRREKKLTIV